MTAIELRTARPEDRDFLQSLSPRLSGVPGPAWHDLAAMEGFQARYMAATAFAVMALAGLAVAAAYDRRIAAIFVIVSALVFLALRLVAVLLM